MMAEPEIDEAEIVEEVVKRKRPKPEPLFYRMSDGGVLVPADRWAAAQVCERNYRNGQVVGVTIRRLRSGGLNRRVHKIGALCVKHLEDFRFTDSHGAIKRLQLEGDIACEVVKIRGEDGHWYIVKVPRSISYSAMDEAEFEQVAFQICTLISERYWHGVTPDRIGRMAELMVDAPS